MQTLGRLCSHGVAELKCTRRTPWRSEEVVVVMVMDVVVASNASCQDDGKCLYEHIHKEHKEALLDVGVM
jgi:hypothetical protein